MSESTVRSKAPLSKRLADIIIREMPDLVDAKPEAVAEAAMEVAELLGYILAPVIMRRGPDDFKEYLKKCILRTTEKANESVAIAKSLMAKTVN